MQPINIFLLAALACSNVQANQAIPGVTTERTPEEAQRALIDFKAVLRVSPRILSVVPKYYTKFQVCSKINKPTSCTGDFEAFSTEYLAKSRAEMSKLDKEEKELEVLCRSSAEPVCQGMNSGAYAVIQSEKQDLQGGLDSISEMKKLQSVGGFGKLGVDAKMALFKEAIPEQFISTIKKNPNKSIAAILNSNSGYNTLIKNFKRLIMAINLYTDPKAPASATDPINAQEYIKKDFKLDLQKINAPAGRFSVVPILTVMNIEILKAQNPGKSAPEIIKIYKANQSKFVALYGKTELKSEIDILVKASGVIFSAVDQNAEDRTITFDLFKDRLMVFERAVEGIIKRLNDGEVIPPANIEKYVKMWLYAKQIVEVGGTDKAMFGFKEMPEPAVVVTAAAAVPVAAAVAEPKEVAKDEVRARSDSTASTSSTGTTDSAGSTSSKKSVLSYFGFK